MVLRLIGRLRTFLILLPFPLLPVFMLSKANNPLAVALYLADRYESGIDLLLTNSHPKSK